MTELLITSVREGIICISVTDLSLTMSVFFVLREDGQMTQLKDKQHASDAHSPTCLLPQPAYVIKTALKIQISSWMKTS